MIRVKICGLSTADALDTALDAGADIVGFVFFPPSPRNLSLDAARALAVRVEGRAQTVVLTVDAQDATLDGIVAALDPDAIQLHGTETPERVADVRARTGKAVWKAVGIAAARDLEQADAYRAVADTILFDAKPPRGAALPGGNGQAFDWRILRDVALSGNWMLSGGLTPANVTEALRVTRATAVDVSSGVEVSPGVKDQRLIRAFIDAVRRVSPALRSG